MTTRRDPLIWPLLILPFGIQNGFVRIGVAFIATQRGLHITDGALLVGAQFATQWMKWLWAPIVDLTLTHKAWYQLATTASALSVFAICAIPLSADTLPMELAILAVGGLANSFVGMSVEAMMISGTAHDDIGRASGWFQAGSLGGIGIGGGLGLLLLETLPHSWMTGAALAALIVSPSLVLQQLPTVAPALTRARPVDALRALVRDVREILRSSPGRLVFIVSMLPIGLGAAFSVLAQATVASHWGAGVADVAFLQGVLAGVAAIAGALLGGRLCDWRSPLDVYAGAGASLGLVAAAMSIPQPTVRVFTAGTVAYAFVTGIAYASFTAVVMKRVQPAAAATEYNIFASLANLPLWWLGMLLGWVAQRYGANAMLRTEAVVGLAGVIALLVLSTRFGSRALD